MRVLGRKKTEQETEIGNEDSGKENSEIPRHART